jgi:hypothetical protein
LVIAVFVAFLIRDSFLIIIASFLASFIMNYLAETEENPSPNFLKIGFYSILGAFGLIIGAFILLAVSVGV